MQPVSVFTCRIFEFIVKTDHINELTHALKKICILFQSETTFNKLQETETVHS